MTGKFALQKQKQHRRPVGAARPERTFNRCAMIVPLVFVLALGLGQVRVAVAGQQPAAQRSQQASSATPRIHTDAASYDFGTTWIDAELKHTFMVSNNGKASLEIQDVRSSYGCAVVSALPKVLKPGETAPLAVKLDPHALRRRYEKRVSITSNDPKHPSLTLRLRGECKPFVEVSPLSASFGKITADAFLERIVTFKNNTDKPLHLEMDQSPSNAEFQYQLVETIDSQEYKLYVNTAPAYKPGTHRSIATIKTNVPAQSTIKINTYAIVPERIEVSPSSIPWRSSGRGGPSETGPAVTKVLRLSNQGTRPVNLLAAICTDPQVKVSTHVIQPGRQYRVLVHFPAGYSPPKGGAGVTLKTSDKQYAMIEVPIGRGRPTSLAKKGRRSSRRPKKKRPALELIGKGSPTFSLETLDGTRVSNAEFEFHPATVLNFFAPNCPFCKRQLPKVEKLRAQFEAQGIRFVNISERMRKTYTPEEVQEAVNALGANLELAIDPGNKVGRRFKVTAFPCLFIVRNDGTIDHVVAGNKKNIQQIVGEKLSRLLLGETGSKESSSAVSSVTSQPAAG